MKVESVLTEEQRKIRFKRPSRRKHSSEEGEEVEMRKEVEGGKKCGFFHQPPLKVVLHKIALAKEGAWAHTLHFPDRECTFIKSIYLAWGEAYRQAQQ